MKVKNMKVKRLLTNKGEWRGNRSWKVSEQTGVKVMTDLSGEWHSEVSYVHHEVKIDVDKIVTPPLWKRHCFRLTASVKVKHMTGFYWSEVTSKRNTSSIGEFVDNELIRTEWSIKKWHTKDRGILNIHWIWF